MSNKQNDLYNETLLEALTEAAELSLAMIKDRFLVEHGMEDVGRAWGACERALKLAKGE